MRERAHRPLRPQGPLSIASMSSFATYYRQTMPAAAAREAIEHMYRALGGGGYSANERQHIQQQLDAKIGV
jgi:hypothetical protein